MLNFRAEIHLGGGVMSNFVLFPLAAIALVFTSAVVSSIGVFLSSLWPPLLPLTQLLLAVLSSCDI